MLSITKEILGKPLFGVETKDLDRNSTACKNAAITYIGRKKVVVESYDDDEEPPKVLTSKDVTKRHSTYTIHTGNTDNFLLGFEDGVVLHGEFGKGWILFETKERCQEFINKANMIENVRSMINLHLIKQQLSKMSTKDLEAVQKAFSSVAE